MKQWCPLYVFIYSYNHVTGEKLANVRNACHVCLFAVIKAHKTPGERQSLNVGPPSAIRHICIMQTQGKNDKLPFSRD